MNFIFEWQNNILRTSAASQQNIVFATNIVFDLMKRSFSLDLIYPFLERERKFVAAVVVFYLWKRNVFKV